MESNIFFNTSDSRFETSQDGLLAYAEFVLKDDEITFTHTFVPKALAGRGIASDLAKYALNMARERKWKVIPLCPFFKSFIERNKGYSDLIL